jgi:hypothetical protein
MRGDGNQTAFRFLSMLSLDGDTYRTLIEINTRVPASWMESNL